MREWTTNSVPVHGLFFTILSRHDSVIYVNSRQFSSAGVVAAAFS
jgi:hypothetical protein